MAKQADDNLESFFRNRVGDYKIDYREEDWQNLNEMLDAADVMKAGALRQKIVWLGSGALLVICILLLLWMSQNLTGNRINNITIGVNPERAEIAKSKDNLNEVENAESILKDEDKINENQVKVAKDPDGHKGDFEDSGNSNDADISQNQNQNQAFIQPLKIIENQSISSPKRVEETVPFENKEEPELAILENSPSIDTPKTPNDNSSNKIVEKEAKEKTAVNIIPKEEENVIGPTGDGSIKNNGAELITTIENQHSLQEAAPLSKPPTGLNLALVNENRFNISVGLRESSNKVGLRKNFAWNISLAADNSAVGMSDFSGPKLRAGISAEHYFSPNASIMAGVNYSIKEYTAFGKEYKVAYGNWNNGVTPDETFGSCNVLDVPINFTYYIQNKNGQAFFLRGGLSSWLMLEEHYYFSYNSNDPDLVGYWEGKNENYHYFSIFNVSGGFEYPLNPKYSIIAEPYLNVPLGGVGYGSVKLYSAGLRFIMKINHYKLVSVK